MLRWDDNFCDNFINMVSIQHPGIYVSIVPEPANINIDPCFLVVNVKLPTKTLRVEFYT